MLSGSDAKRQSLGFITGAGRGKLPKTTIDEERGSVFRNAAISLCTSAGVARLAAFVMFNWKLLEITIKRGFYEAIVVAINV